MKIYLGNTHLSIENSLHRAGFDCVKISMTSGFHSFLSHYPDQALQGIFVLGLTVPEKVKRNWIMQLRLHYPQLAIIIVAQTSQIDLIHSLLQIGGDDWLSDSVRADEWIARIGVLLRRKYPEIIASKILNASPYQFSSFPNQVFREGQEIFLASKEYEVAYFLFSHLEQAVSRKRIFDVIWADSSHEMGRTVDTYVSRVRNRLGLKDGAYGYVLDQLYGYGYLLHRV